MELGLAGIGDLIDTCNSGRSTTAGLLFAEGYSVEDIKKRLYPNEIKAFQTLSVVNRYIKNLRKNNPDAYLALPLIEGSYEVVFNNVKYEDMMNEMINRPKKKELRFDPYLVFE
jgi:glycerol-3-phosphate dehydrogenase (NAD(P)+)